MQSELPDILYVNLGATAGSNVIPLPLYPNATVQESRFASILPSLGHYQVAVVRCVLAGARCFPIFIPSIVQGQSNGALTNYSVSIAVDVTQGSVGTTFPTVNPTNYVLNIQTYNTGGNIITPWARVPVSYTNQNAANWAQSIQVAILAMAGTDPVLSSMSVTISPLTNVLQFQTANPTTSFDISIGFFGDWPYGSAAPAKIGPSAVNAFGMTNLPPPPTSSPSSFVLSSISATLLTPNVPFYTPPTVIGTYSATVPLLWVSQFGVDLPDPRTLNTFDSQAYWCMDFEWWVGILNTALASCANAVLSQAVLKGTAINFQAPYVSYNQSSRLFSLFADAAWVPSLGYPNGQAIPAGPGQIGGTMRIGFNSKLQDLMQMPCVYSYATGDAALNFSQARLAASPAISGANGVVELVNDYPCTSTLWSPVDSLVFTTNAIPVRNETTPAVAAPGAATAGLGVSTSTTRDATAMLTDVYPVNTDCTGWRADDTVYSPQWPRWADLTQSRALLQLDFTLWWRNSRSGTITPVKLNPDANFSVKLAFRRKGAPFA